MRARQKSQRGFVAITLITLLAIALVIAVYATILGTFQGDQVTVVTLTGHIRYDEANSTTASDWETTLSNIANGSEWYALFNITSGGYAGAVTITWWLQENTGSWQNMTTPVEQTTSDTLSGSTEIIYASGNGDQAGNKDWGASTTSAGTYRIKMKIVTA